jgi:glycerol-3-phosphate responsive antiterminator
MDLDNKVMRIQKTMKLEKRTKKRTRKIYLNLHIDVIHDIQKDCGGISFIHNNIVKRDVPILIQRTVLINIPPLVNR